ncbi:RidA family protein [Aldersonia sp. NBC_00410]|uniref:RidA family protein n=1 Tax=Aldersonia sp. NBC_00410 TaxID=2975954 RepID=UPI0022548C1B|nr:RidA family protein [Aldersonia sp. NBC_00410]MCX5044421.1 RidA family protein [Aldersonia sp. NBC_00410]
MTTTTNPLRINPSTWNADFGFDHGQLRTRVEQLLTVAGQGATDTDGTLLHEGDVCAQLALAMHNVESVLTAAGMDLADVIRMTVYTTDVDATLAAYDAVVERLAAAGATPPATLVGVTRLALAGMAVEIEVTAAR